VRRAHVGLLAMLAAGPVHAQSVDDQVFDLASIEAAHEICHFDLTDEQQDVIEQRRQALTDHDGISAAEMASVGDQVAASLRKQVPEGLCRPDGPEAKLYRRKLAAYGLL
jgi:hypothetical protein